MQDEQSDQNASPKPRHSWKRFSIRTLLVMTALVALLIARWRSQLQLEREFVQFIQEHEGSIVYCSTNGPGVMIHHWHPSVSDLFVTRELFVFMDTTKMSSSARKRVFDQLSRVRTIVLLDVRGADDQILAAIGRSLTRLDTLHIEGLGVSDAGLACLRSLENLEVLTLDNTSVSGRGFSDLHGVATLEILGITSSKMTDAGTAELIDFPNLWWISLESNNQLTEATVHHLGRMKSLTQVNLNGTSVTNEEASKLWTLLPKLERLNGLRRPAALDHPSTEQRSEQTESKPAGSPRP